MSPPCDPASHPLNTLTTIATPSSTAGVGLGGDLRPTPCRRLGGGSDALWKDAGSFANPGRPSARTKAHPSALVGAVERGDAQAGIEPAMAAEAT